MIASISISKNADDFPSDSSNFSGAHYVDEEFTSTNASKANMFNFSYDSLGRTISLQDPDLRTWNYTYDSLGNLLAQEGSASELIADGDYYREYNALHQLIRVRQGNTSSGRIIEEYWYDANGERIMTVRNENGQNTTIYTPFKEWMMIQNATGTYNYTYVYDGNTLVARINPDGTKWFYHDDHLGSTSLITDQNGNVVEETFYYPFGQTTSGGKQEAYLLYTNQFKDAVGCYDYGARVYCPKWYHFTSGDPITANVFEPQKLNKYAYVVNNPYVFIDPTGKKVKKFGASKGYASSGTWSSKYGDKGKSSGAYYQVTYQVDQDEERTIHVSAEDFEALQQKAKEYADKSVYAWFSDLTRDVETEYIVAELEQMQGRAYEQRSPLQRVLQNVWTQGALSVTAGVVGGILGGPLAGASLGGGLAGTFAKADITEIEAVGGETSLGNILWAYGDVAAGALGGTVIGTAGKEVLKQGGLEIGKSIVYDAAAETTAEVSYQTVKNEFSSDKGENNE